MIVGMHPLAAGLLALVSLFPVHGTVLHRDTNTIVLKTDAVTNIQPATTRLYQLERPIDLLSGQTIDAIVDRSTTPWTLREARGALAFTPGMPNGNLVKAVDVGDVVPDYPFVDQRGRVVRFSDFRGKTVIAGFIFTRCPDKDECPLITAKFGYLQKHLDPRRFHLAEISLDPVYDSPAILARYGSTFGANAAHWSMLTGEPAQLADLFNQLSISSLHTEGSNIIHDDKLLLIDPSGRITSIVTTAGWAPDDIVAQARHVFGDFSNPFDRLRFNFYAGLISLCGGSESTALIVMNSIIFILGVVILGGALIWIGINVFWKESRKEENT
ncbi:MAG: SCO family protein [Candidatus Eremiobacteraeota bacterium]|nr:SCO family protein [Candidatus Eremiobacteraeota bacterium]